MKGDELQHNYGLKYDHRNLLIEISRLISENETELTRYYYDEAGNRIRKLILRCWTGPGGIPDPPVWDDIGNMPIYDLEMEGGEGWSIFKNEFYVRGVGGNELAIYNFDQLEQWNVWGTDNVGKITKEEEEEFNFYYLKDHLGSIRAVINEDNEVVNAQDYDMWGFLLENRTFDIEREKYKFTGKERDEESSYDYFGARYYMSRIGRWGSIDPLLEQHYDFSPYNYVLDNPLIFIDPDGKQIPIQVLLGARRIKSTYEDAMAFSREWVKIAKIQQKFVSDINAKIHWEELERAAHKEAIGWIVTLGPFNRLFIRVAYNILVDPPIVLKYEREQLEKMGKYQYKQVTQEYMEDYGYIPTQDNTKSNLLRNFKILTEYGEIYFNLPINVKPTETQNLKNIESW